MSRHLSTRKFSSKSIHALLTNLANRQTDRRTRANAFTSSFVGGNKAYQCNSGPSRDANLPRTDAASLMAPSNEYYENACAVRRQFKRKLDQYYNSQSVS